MHRFSLMILLSIMFALSAWAQQDTDTGVQETEPPESASGTASEAEAEAEIEDPEEPVVDDEFYQDVDDKDFRPSEDIPADQSIAFPTDI